MLEVRVLGRFEIHLEGQPVEIPSRPAQSLLAYLMLNAGTAHRREMVAGLLWPDSDEENARNNLRHTLWRLRKSIGGHYFLSDKLTVSFDASQPHYLDAAALEGVPPEDSLDGLTENVSVYGGELLPGFYEDWVLLERERLQALYEQKMKRLLDRMVQEGRWAAVLEWAERWIARGRIPEPAYQALMRAHHALGDAAGLAAAYRRCRAVLRDDLGVDPSPQTVRLFEQLSRQETAEEALQPPLEAPPARSLPVETAGPAPAFLRPDAAQGPGQIFVGREDELAQLGRFLAQAVEGSGQIALVVGESGRGKTALMEEFARRAQDMSSELIVALGACDDYAGIGDPFLPFREVMMMLAGDVESRWISGSIARDQAVRLWEASPLVIQALVEHGPDLIGSFVTERTLAARLAEQASDGRGWPERLKLLLTREVRLEPGGAPHQNRIFEEYTDVLLDIAKRHPLLIGLDDLQWADASSASLLFHLGRRIGNAPILIVGTYRPEDLHERSGDSKHPLEGVLSEFKHIYGDIWVDLDRWSEEANLEFVDALLDVEPNRLGRGFRQEFARITSGHPLFTNELLREMKARGHLTQDAAGRWVESAELALDFMPARVEGVIEERIGHLDSEMREALTIASVEGEVFTAEVVAGVMGVDEVGLVRRLSRELQRVHRLVQEADVRETAQRRLSQYRFRHNLFRRYLYTTLGEVERAYLHEAVGNALEDLYADGVEEIAFQLALHFQAAGVSEKALRYLHLAGNQALRVSAYEEAVLHLESALALLEERAESPGSTRQPPERLVPPLEEVRLNRRLGEAYYYLGDLEKSREHYEHGLQMLGITVPASQGRLTAGLLGQIATQSLHRLVPGLPFSASESNRSRQGEAASLLQMLGEVYLFLEDPQRVGYAAIRSLNLAEPVGHSPQLARAYAGMSVIVPQLGLHSLAERYRRMALQAAGQVGQPSTTAYVLLAGSLFLAGEGRQPECKQSLAQANEILAEIGDWNRLAIGLALMGTVYAYEGDFGRRRQVLDELGELAERSGSLQHQIWSLNAFAEHNLVEGGTDALGEAIALLKKSLSTVEVTIGRAEEIYASGMLAAAHLRKGEFEAAFQVAERTVALMRNYPPNTCTQLEGYAGMVETYLSLWETGSLKGEAGKIRQRSKWSLGELRKLARVFPVGRPRAALWQGAYEWLEGNRTRAGGSWQRALAIARDLGMPYEEANCYLQIGRHAEPGDPSRRDHLRRAEALFAELGAGYGLAAARGAQDR